MARAANAPAWRIPLVIGDRAGAGDGVADPMTGHGNFPLLTASPAGTSYLPKGDSPVPWRGRSTSAKAQDKINQRSVEECYCGKALSGLLMAKTLIFAAGAGMRWRVPRP